MRRAAGCLGFVLAVAGCRSSQVPPAAPARLDASGPSTADARGPATADGGSTADAGDPGTDTSDPVLADAGSDQRVVVADGPPVTPDVAGSPAPDPRFIPRPVGDCPEFAPGMITVRPGGIPRQARVWMSDAARTLDGPLVFYWYGTNGSPAQAEQALGSATIAAITGAGGLLVAPVHDPTAGTWPWFLVSGAQDNDLRLADELLACAVQKVGVDLRRVHALGFSAGAIHTVQMSWRRSGYLASVVTFSGAQSAAIADQDPGSKLAAMIFHGGANDRVFVGFQAGSERYHMELQQAGRFSLICNHNLGHRVPAMDAAGVWRFLQDHPFGTAPEPYVGALPPEIPRYCLR